MFSRFGFLSRLRKIGGCRTRYSFGLLSGYLPILGRCGCLIRENFLHHSNTRLCFQGFTHGGNLCQDLDWVCLPGCVLDFRPPRIYFVPDIVVFVIDIVSGVTAKTVGYADRAWRAVATSLSLSVASVFVEFDIFLGLWTPSQCKFLHTTLPDLSLKKTKEKRELSSPIFD